MIYYDWQNEEWTDDDDEEFSVSMTPESKEDCQMDFENQEEFWVWYRAGAADNYDLISPGA